ncbi:MAG: DUF3857 domain-containing transglutaminase family protein [Reichenbachiella sp.]
MKSILILIGLYFPLCIGYAQKYSVASIPEELLKNADAVIRLEKGHYEINDYKNIVYTYKRVVTILRPNAAGQARESIYYNKSISILNLKASVYNSQGIAIQKLKKDDILDVSISSEGEFTDGRSKSIDLTQKEYPYTVEVSYNLKLKSLYFLNSWKTIKRHETAVEQSLFSIQCPDNLLPNYRLENAEIEPLLEKNEGTTSLTFDFKNIKAIQYEPYSWGYSFPQVLIAPSKFIYDNYEGDFSSWDAMGDWQNLLNVGRDTLAKKTIEKIRKLTENCNNDIEKAKVVYNYVQKNTRYVSIQLGIGGWQPIPAARVDEIGYGDCKALSNYTMSLLKAVGVLSHYTIVYGGRNPPKVRRDFPRDTFNHIILCVPNKGDTLWLECTSQTNPFAYQGKFTGDRDVLIVTEEGGKLVHTTVYHKKDNIQSRIANVKIGEDGHANASIITHFQGLQYENGNLDYYFHQNYDEQKKWVLENTDIPNFKLVDFSFEIQKDRIPSIDQNLEVELNNYAQSSGERLFIPLNLMNNQSFVPRRNSDRQTDIEIKTPFVDYDSIVFEVPESIHPEFVPEKIQFSSEFGEYESEVMVENGRVIYVRKYGMNKGVYPKESYDDFRSFFKKVKKADKSKIVFLKNT